jgi:hypothetical protein
MHQQFHGKTYDDHRDKDRLKKQSLTVFNLMVDSKWRTLRDIELLTGYPQSSISARLRDFRKTSFGGHAVNREYVSKGLFKYQLIINGNKAKGE